MQQWRNMVRQSWNGLLSKDETINVFVKDTMMGQLDSLDDIFVTRFSGLESFFMKGSDTWKGAFPTYIQEVSNKLENCNERICCGDTHGASIPTYDK
jgi:hypothetical protein